MYHHTWTACISRIRSNLVYYHKYLPCFTVRYNYSTNLFSPRVVNDMSCYLQVLGTGSSEVAPCLFLFTESGRYLFNCPENLQTITTELSVKVRTKLKNVFLTRSTWENIGGLPGLVMSSRDSGISHFSLMGPRGLAMFPDAVKIFLRQEKLKLDVSIATNELDQAVVYNDDVLSVTAVELMPSSVEQTSDCSDSSEDSGNELGIIEGQPLLKRPRLKTKKPRVDSVVAYIGKLATVRGKFNLKKALELGLPPGPLFRNLTEGHPVTAPNGDVIYPHQVMGPDQIGPQFVVVECPSFDYVSSLTSHPLLQHDQLSPLIIVHITPNVTLQTDPYQQWMLSFGKDTKHLLLHSDFCPPELSLKSCLKIQLPLHIMAPDIFRLPCMPHFDSCIHHINHPSVIVGQNSLMFHLRPIAKTGAIEYGSVPSVETVTRTVLENMATDSDLQTRLQQYPTFQSHFKDALRKSKLMSSAFLSPPSEPLLEPSVTFLGTGSAFPSQYRNVSGILLHLPNGDYILLDAGEGVIGQLYKCFGPQRADNILHKLKCVFVSHIHGDHHLGLIRCLLKRDKLVGSTSEPLLIIGPQSLKIWLSKYGKHCQRLRFKFQDASLLVSVADKPSAIPDVLSDIRELTTVPVIHTVLCYGIVVSHKNGWKIVYSGDTRPCPELIAAGKGASLLIHEATFDHSLLEEAVARKHSTDVEALQVATDMEAEFLILTHFSQRYPKVSAALFNGLSSKKVGVAFDYMSVRLSELDRLSSLLPLMQDILLNNDDKETESIVLTSWM